MASTNNASNNGGNSNGANGNGANDDKSSAKSGAQYHCDYCRSDITSQVRIKCAECKVRHHLMKILLS